MRDSSSGVTASGYLRGTTRFVAAAAGLELAERHDPDLVTLDLVMPRMDGLAAAAALRSDLRTRHVPLVMVTTSTSPVHLARARSIGVDAYLTKPFDPDELVRVVRELLATGHGRDESGGATPLP